MGRRKITAKSMINDSCDMDNLGQMTMDGKVKSQTEVVKSRERKGECVNCGQKCYRKKVFRLEPLTVEGKVLNGRCLICDPIVPAAAPVSKSNTAKKGVRKKHTKHSPSLTSITSGASAHSVSSAPSVSSGNSASAATPVSPTPSVKHRSLVCVNHDSKHTKEDNANKKMDVQVEVQNLKDPHSFSKCESNNEYAEPDKEIESVESVESVESEQAEGSEDKHDKGIFSERQMHKIYALSQMRLNMMNISKQKVVEQNAELSEQDILNGAAGVDYQKILSAIHKLPHSTELYVACCTVLSDIDYSPGDINDLVEMGAIAYVVNKMNEFSDNVKIQETGCITITKFSSMSKVLKNEFTKLEGVTAALFALMSNQGNVDLTHLAMGAIDALCEDNDENKHLVVNVGGIDYIALAMENSRDNLELQRKGCWLISNLALDPEVNSVLASYGAIDLVIRSMWVHIGDAFLQEGACLSLGTFAYDPSWKNRILKLDGLSVIMTVIQTHPLPSVLGKALWALSEIAKHADDDKFAMVESGLLNLLLDVMDAHPENLEVQEKSLTLLLELHCSSTAQVMPSKQLHLLLQSAQDVFPQECGHIVKSLQIVL